MWVFNILDDKYTNTCLNLLPRITVINKWCPWTTFVVNQWKTHWPNSSVQVESLANRKLYFPLYTVLYYYLKSSTASNIYFQSKQGRCWPNSTVYRVNILFFFDEMTQYQLPCCDAQLEHLGLSAITKYLTLFIHNFT